MKFRVAVADADDDTVSQQEFAHEDDDFHVVDSRLTSSESAAPAAAAASLAQPNMAGMLPGYPGTVISWHVCFGMELGLCCVSPVFFQKKPNTTTCCLFVTLVLSRRAPVPV